MAKFIAHIETNHVGSRIEVPFEVEDEDLEDLDAGEQFELIEETARDVIAGHYEWGWRET